MNVNGNKKLFIVGDSSFAQVAYEYFTYDSEYEVVGFSVEGAYLERKELFGLPVYPLEEIEKYFPPDKFEVFVAITYRKLNRTRTRLYKTVKQKGYKIASYISSKAFVWKNVKIGENTFIFENNVIQPFVEIGNNVILWSGNHIGHHSIIKDNCFISSHVVISGHCKIGKNCFFGVNSTIANDIIIADDTFVSAGAVVMKNTEKGKVYMGNPAEPRKVTVYRKFRITEDEVD